MTCMKLGLSHLNFESVLQQMLARSHRHSSPPSFLRGKILIRQSELMDRGAKYVLVGGAAAGGLVDAQWFRVAI